MQDDRGPGTNHLVQIYVANHRCTVPGASEQEYGWLHEYLVIRRPKFTWDRYAKRASYDGEESEYLFDMETESFPGGFLAQVVRKAREKGFEVVVHDERVRPAPPDPHADLHWLRDYQHYCVQQCLVRERGIVHAATGCHRKGQLIMRSDGSLVRVEDVQVGDRLMGPDGLARNVLELRRGIGKMVQVVPTKGKSFVVNEDHVLTLVRTNGHGCDGEGGALVDVTVREWRMWNSTKKHMHKLVRSSGIETFDRESVFQEITPYFLGVLLGDGGLTQGVRVFPGLDHAQIGLACHEEAERFGLWASYDVSGGDDNLAISLVGNCTRGKNPLVNVLKGLGLYGTTSHTKFIPDAYKYGEYFERLELLAGLIDTDGNLSGGGFDFVTASQRLAEDVAFVARSVGMAAYPKRCEKADQHGTRGVYYRVYISGDVSDIPTRIPRKQAVPRQQKKDVLRTGFSVVELDVVEDYYGFTLDQDHRYLLDDFTITHNSGKTEMICALTRSLPKTKFLILVHRSQLMGDIAKRIQKRAQEHGLDAPDIGLYGDQKKELGSRITVATFQALNRNKKNPNVKAMIQSAEALIIDEAHTAPAGQFTGIIELAKNAYYRWGVSGTPLDRSDRRSIVTIGLLGPVIARVTSKELIDAGVLARPTVRFVRYDAPDCYASDWATARKQGIVESRARNQAVLNAVKRAHKPCLLFVEILEHGEFLTKKLQQARINTEFVWANKKTGEREAALERLVRGDIDVVCCSSVFNEGIDVPSLRSVVLAAGGKSVIQVLQRIGRGMRRTDDKDTFQIWDFEDTAHRMLEDHMVARKRSYKREGHEIVVDSEALKLPPPRAIAS